MEAEGVPSCSQFDVEMKTLVDALLRDVCALAARWSAALRRENLQLRRRLRVLEHTLSHRTHTEHPHTPAQHTQPASVETGHVCTIKTVNLETEPTGHSRGQRERIPALSGMKEEEMEISVTGRAQYRLNAACSDASTAHFIETEVNFGLMSECESNTEPEIPNPELCRDDHEDDAQDCLVVDEGRDAEDQSSKPGHLALPKTEEKQDDEEYKEQEHLIAPHPQLNSTSLHNNSEPSSSDCSLFVIMEGSAGVSTKDTSDQSSDSAERVSGPSQNTKQKGPRYICNLCGKSLSSKYSLSVHFTLHTGDRPYACTQCGKRFVNRTNLQIHQNIHTGAKPYVCSLCPKSFADPSPFGRHKRMHNRELQQSNHSPKCQFICNICGKSLSTKQGLSYHITMHTGERPYTCTWCGKSFVQKHNLKIHQNIHTGAKPYACTLCPKSFADPSSLKKHKRMHV